MSDDADVIIVEGEPVVIISEAEGEATVIESVEAGRPGPYGEIPLRFFNFGI
jgi:hypothetical protein